MTVGEPAISGCIFYRGVSCAGEVACTGSASQGGSLGCRSRSRRWSFNRPATPNGPFERPNSGSCPGVEFRTGACGPTRQRSSHLAQCSDDQGCTIKQFAAHLDRSENGRRHGSLAPYMNDRRTSALPPHMRLTTGWMFIGDTIMRKVAIAATLLSFALVGSASAQQVVATNPVTGAATGAAAGAAQGAAVAGPLGALVGAPLGLAAGAVAGTVGAVGTVAGGLVGAPFGVAGVGFNYCPAGYTPVTPPNTLPPNVTGVGYCQAPATVAYAQPVTTRVAYAYPRRNVRRLAYRTRAYRRVAFRTGP